jgi:hypothetical protein
VERLCQLSLGGLERVLRGAVAVDRGLAVGAQRGGQRLERLEARVAGAHGLGVRAFVRLQLLPRTQTNEEEEEEVEDEVVVEEQEQEQEQEQEEDR